MISTSNIAISLDEIEALVGDSPNPHIEPEPSKHPEESDGICRHTTFSYPPLDPVSSNLKPKRQRTYSMISG